MNIVNWFRLFGLAVFLLAVCVYTWSATGSLAVLGAVVSLMVFAQIIFIVVNSKKHKEEFRLYLESVGVKVDAPSHDMKSGVGSFQGKAKILRVFADDKGVYISRPGLNYFLLPWGRITHLDIYKKKDDVYGARVFLAINQMRDSSLYCPWDLDFNWKIPETTTYRIQQ